MHDRLLVAPEVEAALTGGGAVVALETTLIAHGLPWPGNLETVETMCAAIRATGAVPALIGLAGGRIHIGMDSALVRRFAQGTGVEKASRRDLAALLASGRDGATTVAGTMFCAALAGIRVFATGGIGGVHRGAERNFDVSADLTELARTAVAVVCSGAKSILDLPRTLEVLETAGVPVLGFGCDDFPAFHTTGSGLPVSARVDTATAAAQLIELQLELGAGGVLVACPIPAAEAIERARLEGWIATALAEATQAGITGKAVTPWLLSRLAVLSDGATLVANRALLHHNAEVAAHIAVALSGR